MTAERAYKWGAAFFGIAAVSGVAALSYSTSWVEYRLLLVMMVAAIICTVAMVTLSVIARREERLETSASSLHRFIIVRAALSSLVVGVLYTLIAYTIGLLRIPGGPHNLSWGLGIPVVVAWMGKPSLRGLKLGCPLALTGFACFIIIGLTLGMPLD